MQRVADQAQAAKAEASEALLKETALRSKLEVLCKEVRGALIVLTTALLL